MSRAVPIFGLRAAALRQNIRNRHGRQPPGVPAGNHRYVPDVALSAAAHDGYLTQYKWRPVHRERHVGILSFLCRTYGACRSGYRQASGKRQCFSTRSEMRSMAPEAPAVFHNITSGNNSVPGQTGYSCTAGYSPVTGLGSVDANAFVNAMQSLTGTFGLTSDKRRHWRMALSPAVRPA